MKILVKNLGTLPYSLDIGEFDDGMVRPLLAITGTSGDTIDIGERVDPWDFNVQRQIRQLVTPPGSATVMTLVAGGYSMIGSPPGQLSVTFLQDPNDLVFLFAGSGSTGITAAQHEVLRQLIHFVDEGPAHGFASGATKIVLGGLFPTSIVWWDKDPGLGGAKKIVEKVINRSVSLLFPTSVTWTIYDIDGTTILQQLVDNISYGGVAETKRVRTIL